MKILSRWLASAALAAGLGVGAIAPAQAQDDALARVIVDVADVIFRGGYPYYRYGPGYGYNDRLIVVHDRYRRPVYYRYVPRTTYYRSHNAPPYGNAYGYWREGRWYDGRQWHDRNYDYRERERWESRRWRDDRRDWDRDRGGYRKIGKGRGRHHHDD